jgi:hypothetical protein
VARIRTKAAIQSGILAVIKSTSQATFSTESLATPVAVAAYAIMFLFLYQIILSFFWIFINTSSIIGLLYF